MTLIDTDYPIHKWPEGLRCYYLFTMGYHLHQMVWHLIEDTRNDFVEMFLHHIVTLALYGFSYLTNMTAAGAVIMYLHDWADIFAGLVRCFTETTFDFMSIISVIGMATSWFFTRLYVFPQIIYYSCFKYDIYKGAGFTGDKYFGLLLSILFVLHIHWFILIIKSVRRYAIKGKAEDLQ